MDFSTVVMPEGPYNQCPHCGSHMQDMFFDEYFRYVVDIDGNIGDDGKRSDRRKMLNQGHCLKCGNYCVYTSESYNRFMAASHKHRLIISFIRKFFNKALSAYMIGYVLLIIFFFVGVEKLKGWDKPLHVFTYAFFLAAVCFGFAYYVLPWIALIVAYLGVRRAKLLLTLEKR